MGQVGSSLVSTTHGARFERGTPTMRTRRHAALHRGDWSRWLLRCEYRGKGVSLGTYPDITVDRTPTPRIWRYKREHRWEDPKLRFVFILILGPLNLKLAVDDD